MADLASLLALFIAIAAIIIAITALVIVLTREPMSGPKGDTGIQGPRGIIGPQGNTGPQGTKGDTGASGMQGPTGDRTGLIGPTGLQGATKQIGPVSTVPGPTGPTGQIGNIGPTGAPSGQIGLNGILINKIVSNSSGAVGDITISLENVNRTNITFNARNEKNTTNTIYINILAKDYNVGDAFSITNIGHNIRLSINPQGFSNLTSTAGDNNYILKPKDINTALILITVGSNPTDKNVNIIFSTT